jgi:hypothetical protein
VPAELEERELERPKLYKQTTDEIVSIPRELNMEASLMGLLSVHFTT